MVGEVLPTITTMFNEVFNLFGRIFTEFDAWLFFLGGFVIYMSYRFLLAPIIGTAIGVGASDTVKKIRSKGNKEG